MKIDDYMNPNRSNVQTDCFVLSGTEINDICQKDIDTESDYIGIKNDEGEMLGAIRTERLRYILTHDQNMKFSQILDHLSVGVIAIDPDSRIFYVNPAYSRILDVLPGKIIGRYMNKVEKNAALLQVLKTRRAEQRETQLIQSVNKYVAVNMFPLYQDGEFAGACSLFTDITELNHLTNEVERISHVAEEYNRQIQAQEFLKSHHVIGESDAYMKCVRKALMVARTDASVLIRGENGTGKEVICKMIQENGERAKKPFIKVNCAAIPEALMESELFGYEEGSFTGAKKGGRAGKFQLAEGGTLFLDEIGDIPLAMQAKLLRVLQEGEIERIGGQESIPVDVRVIAATNQPLEKMIEDGTFRMDLYYRLNVVTIEIPPLRERGNDMILLANEFLREFNQKYHQDKRLSKDAYMALLQYPWPGNVRELRNILESAVVLSMDDVITASDFPNVVLNMKTASAELPMRNESEKRMVSAELSMRNENETRTVSVQPSTGNDNETECPVYGALKEEVEAFEKKVIRDTLKRFGGNRNQAMEALQVPRRTFYRKLSEYGISGK